MRGQTVKTLTLSMLTMLFAGCMETRPLGWEFDDPQMLADGEVYTAMLREDGCSPDNDLLFISFPELGTRSAPQLTQDGNYCFEVLVFDEQTCEASRGSRLTIPLSASETIDTVFNEIAPLPQTLTCDDVGGTCAPGVGCVQCADNDDLCTPADGTPAGLEYRYCCPTSSLCDDPVFFDCIRLR